MTGSNEGMGHELLFLSVKEKEMVSHDVKRLSLAVCLASVLCLALDSSAAHGQSQGLLQNLFGRKQQCLPPPCPTVLPTYAPAQPAGQAPSQQPGAAKPPDSTQQPTVPPPSTPPAAAPSFGTEQSAATEGTSVALSAPNMLGDLLGAGRSTTFFYQRSQGSVFINNTGSTGVVNPKVADNNSPLPMDRVYFRYNYFNNSQKVTGDSGEIVFDPTLGVSSLSGPRFRGIPVTKSYDVHDFVFGGEKTYLDGMFSVEVRVPFGYTLAHDLTLSVADVVGRGVDEDNDSTNSILRTNPTPQNTLGHSDTEFGNMSVILKGLLYRTQTVAFTAGAAIGIPTARDTHIRVIDFLGDFADNDIEIQRLREFHISNDTWSISPFLAALATPTERFYAQAFLQFDFPVNESTIRYSEQAVVNTEPGELHFDPVNVTERIREQTLMQTDVGIGYWVYKEPHNIWLTGIVPTLELHYTTTLNDADIRVLPFASKSGNLAVVGPNGAPITEPNPQVGNQRNRVDILDLTVGSTFVFADRASVATGFAFPLKQGDDRTFSWEFQLQLNYYFGVGGGSDRRPPPSF